MNMGEHTHNYCKVEAMFSLLFYEQKLTSIRKPLATSYGHTSVIQVYSKMLSREVVSCSLAIKTGWQSCGCGYVMAVPNTL